MTTGTWREAADPTPPSSPWSAPDAPLQRAMVGVCPASTPAQLAEVLFDLRRDLAECLLERSLGDNREEDAAMEDAFRDALPPLHVPPGPFTPLVSPWRAALTALTGLLAGVALVQGLALSPLQNMPGGQTGDPPGGLLLLAAACGAALALWAADRLAASLAFRRRGVGRWARWLGPAILGAAILRDFLLGTPAPARLLGVLGDALRHGLALGLFTNIYTALGLAALFWLGCRRPVRLDVAEYRLRLHLAAQIWWEGATRCADALLRHARNDEERRRLREVGQDLYSFAGELPPTRRAWLEDRLRRLGLEAPRPDGELLWSAELAQRYDPVGYLEPGDRCYADLPPLLENGCLLRKGTVRKVRA